MGRREHEFEPSGPPRTFGAAKKVAAATAQWAAAAAHPPATQRPPLSHSHRMGTAELHGPLSQGQPESGMGVRAARGESAHVHQLKVDIVAVLSTRCGTARPTNWSAGVRRSVFSNGTEFEVPDITRYLMRAELAISCEHIEHWTNRK